MSEATGEVFHVPADATSSIGALLGFLAPEEDAEATAPSGAPNDDAAAGTGQQPPPAEGAAAAGGDAPAPPDGDAGQPAVPNAGPPGDGDKDSGAAGEAGSAGGGAEAATGVDVETILPTFATMATSFEEKQTQQVQASVLGELKEEYAKHFEAVAKPARLLVGEEVPSLKGPGMERLRDSSDARDWQDTVKQLLLDEVKSRTDKRVEDMQDVFTTVHSSIDLFRNNKDLVPGTRQFDTELANAFASQVKDYELRADGKLIGYSVPVQPIINAVRAQLAAQRAATAAPAAPAAPAGTGGTDQPRDAQGRWDSPQAGLRSRAGQSAENDNEGAGVMEAFFRQNGVRI